ncbi:MAG: hypothetical protein JSV80_03515, partial [Acidobacteriota bacterium]
AVLVFVAMPGGATAHPPDEPDQSTVSGEIVDLCCYLSAGATGTGRAPSAKQCAKNGQPIGLLAQDGTLYVLYAHRVDIAPFELAKKLAGENVTLTGVVSQRGSINGLEVRRVSRTPARR